jgi:hypothetical protein
LRHTISQSIAKIGYLPPSGDPTASGVSNHPSSDFDPDPDPELDTFARFLLKSVEFVAVSGRGSVLELALPRRRSARGPGRSSWLSPGMMGRSEGEMYDGSL